MSLIYVIEDEPITADLVTMAARLALPELPEIDTFYDAVSAMDAVSEAVPDLIILDVLLSGPDGFTFLNELASYQDTAKIPVILMSSLDFSEQDLSHYGVVRILDKSTMTPQDISAAVRSILMPSATPLPIEADIVEPQANSAQAPTPVNPAQNSTPAPSPASGNPAPAPEQSMRLDIPHGDK